MAMTKRPSRCGLRSTLTVNFEGDNFMNRVMLEDLDFLDCSAIHCLVALRNSLISSFGMPGFRSRLISERLSRLKQYSISRIVQMLSVPPLKPMYIQSWSRICRAPTNSFHLGFTTANTFDHRHRCGKGPRQTST